MCIHLLPLSSPKSSQTNIAEKRLWGLTGDHVGGGRERKFKMRWSLVEPRTGEDAQES